LVYALLGTLEKKKNPLKFADSLYFLGFLWTLVALINAILPGSLDLSLTLKAFGYALLTTAAGMLLRSVFLQFTEPLPEQALNAQEDLERQIVNVSLRFQKAKEDVDRFGVALQSLQQKQIQTLVLSVEGLNQAIASAKQGAAEVGRAGAENALSGLDEHLKKAVHGFTTLNKTAGQLNDMASNATTLLTNIHELSGSLEKHTGSLRQEISAFGEHYRQSSSLLHAAFESGSKAVERSMSQVASLLARQTTPAADEQASPIEALRSFSLELQTSGSAVRALKKDVDDLTGKIRDTVTGLTELPRTLANVETRTEALSSEALLSVATRLHDLDLSVEQTRRTAESFNEAIREVLEFVRTELSRETIGK